MQDNGESRQTPSLFAIVPTQTTSARGWETSTLLEFAVFLVSPSTADIVVQDES